MIKVLAIGNSFSCDATEYLHQMAERGGIHTKIDNLCIGGCSLSTHWQNAQKDAPDYELLQNGIYTGKMISIKSALLSDNWDYVTIQQASHDSGIPESYYPHGTELFRYIREFAPDACQLVHETWAYEIDSDHSAFTRYNNDQLTMYNALKSAYQDFADSLKLDIIPAGDVIQQLRSLPEFDYANGGISLCRDGFHMDLVYGRYAVAAVWYAFVLNGNISENDFIPPGAEEVDMRKIELIKRCVAALANRSAHSNLNCFCN